MAGLPAPVELCVRECPPGPVQRALRRRPNERIKCVERLAPVTEFDASERQQLVGELRKIAASDPPRAGAPQLATDLEIVGAKTTAEKPFRPTDEERGLLLRLRARPTGVMRPRREARLGSTREQAADSVAGVGCRSGKAVGLAPA